MINISPKNKALLATITLLIIGVYCSISIVDNWNVSLPLTIFYLILLLNTFFSIKLFSSLVSAKDISQNIIDIILFSLYIFLAYKINDYYIFSLITLALFVIATFKYLILLERNIYVKLLKKKIAIDTLGVIACILNMFGIILGYPAQSAWAFTIVFFIANIYLLAIKPMYRID